MHSLGLSQQTVLAGSQGGCRGIECLQIPLMECGELHHWQPTRWLLDHTALWGQPGLPHGHAHSGAPGERSCPEPRILLGHCGTSLWPWGPQLLGSHKTRGNSGVNTAAQAQNGKDSSRVTQHSWGPHSVLWHSKEITLWSQAHHAGPHTRDSVHVGIGFVVQGGWWSGMVLTWLHKCFVPSLQWTPFPP